MYCLSCQNNLNVIAQGLLDGLCPVLFHILQTLPRLMIKACIRESSWDGRGERCVYFPVCRQNPDAIIRGVWLRHRSCPSARPTPPLLDSYTHMYTNCLPLSLAPHIPPWFVSLNSSVSQPSDVINHYAFK